MIDFLERGVTSSSFTKAMGVIAELNVVVGIQDQAHHFRQEFVTPDGQAQRTLFPIPVLATRHIRSKKSDLHLSDRAFPWAQNSFEGQGKPCSFRWIARGNIHQARQTDIC